ncbi:MAG: aldo/keto reductase [Acholeplasmataceae bacterium]
MSTKNEVQISRIGFGGWQLGNPLWGKMSVEEGINLVKLAFQKGITFFDTAPSYSNGLSETIIGLALKDCRDQVFINTKIGHLSDGSTDFSISSMEPQINMSLSRLNTSYLDSVLLHNPSMEILKGKTYHFQELARLKELGLIKHYGVSIDTYEEFYNAITYTNIDIIEVLYNIFFQSVHSLFQTTKDKQIKIIIKVPLDSGWLTGKYHENSIFTGIRQRWSTDDIKRRSNLISEVKSIVNKNDLTATALAFILKDQNVTSVIPGTKNEAQLNQNLNALKLTIDNETYTKLINLYQQKIKTKPLPW